jgi:hypothetical protein
MENKAHYTLMKFGIEACGYRIDRDGSEACEIDKEEWW